ncbi:MAG: hypothetical protein ACRD98_08115, partial [Nitrososphaera sp.]
MLDRTRQHWDSTGSGSDRVLSKRLLRKAPGRYRSRYCTAACPNVSWFDLVRQHLAKLEARLVAALRSLISHNYPPEVFALSFEVFSDTFTSGFPARAFFMDRTNCEYFLYVNGEATYPSPIDPWLLDIDSTYPAEIEDDFLSRDPDLNTWDIATSEFISWFSECWDKA